MGRDELFVTAPSFFRCPISLDVMKSPVSLCTGVTYDRSSIQRWLDGGNNTCPATMQVLQNKDIVPNHTLRRLINIWSESVRRRRKPPPNSTEAAEISAEHQVVPLIEAIEKMPYNCKECLAGIASWGRESEERLRFLAGFRGLLPALINILGGRVGRNADLCAEVVKVLDLVGSEYEDKEELTRLVLKGDLDCLSPMLLVLKRGTLESRLACLRFLERIAVDAESKLQIAEKDGLVSQLLVLMMMPDNNSNTASANETTEACLSCLASISMSKRAKSLVVRVGAVESVSEILSESSLAASCVEKALKLLEMLSSCREGRSEISDNPKCVPAVVQRVLKVSAAATEHAVTILWSVCYLFRDHKAAEAVAKSNGLTKILLLMQSNCSPEVRRMSGDMLKIFRVGSKSCISSYDTKTTHIMPF